jgi:RNA processing factor Prp31
MSDDAYSVKLVVTRGTGSQDKEKMQVEVAADSLDELDEKCNAVRERMREWADDIRAIQPDGRRQHDDQTELGAASP